MGELRDEIADIISHNVAGDEPSDVIADRILALPQIANALHVYDHQIKRLADSPANKRPISTNTKG